MRGPLLTALLVLAACDPVLVPARETGEVYDFRLVVAADSLILRWPNGSRIRVFVQPAGDAGQNANLLAAVRHGSREWESASLYANFSIEQVAMPEEADVIIAWSGSDLPVDVSKCPAGGANAYTTFCLAASQNRLEPFPLRNGTPSHVRFLVTVRGGVGVSAAQLRALVTHELGHVLGLAQHSQSSNDLMYRDPARDTPNARDRATLQVLYQIRPDIVP